MNSNIWKWEQMRKTIREAGGSEPLNQADVCAVKGNQGCCGGLCPGSITSSSSVASVTCEQLTIVLSPGELSHPEVSRLCSYMILMASVNG